MSSKITVAVRVRPLNERELALKAPETVLIGPGQITVSRKIDGYSKAFNFDLTYSADPNSSTFGSQAKVYGDIGEPILEEALKGINQCLFAYGQTGSGKSYTMTGYSDAGVIPRLTTDLFKRVATSNGEIRVWISYMEIYNEKIRDLLKTTESDENLSIFEHDKLGVVVPDATMAPAATVEEARQLMAYGISRRVSAATQMNETSSRSHAICTLHVQTKAAMARINLIDLAGSERISKSEVTGDNRREAAMINQSLTNLGIVIKALSEKKDFVPFRNSKLTFLLKDSLSGNSRTYMVANISPAETEVEETISTLRFASNVKQVVTDPRVNYGTQEDMINALRDEISRLKDQLAASQSPKNDIGAQLKMRSAVLKMIDASLTKKVEKRYTSAQDVPVDDVYLYNISEDPIRTGLLTVVPALPNSTSSIGSSTENDQFLLKGSDILPSMAQLIRQSDRKLELKLTNALAEVSVNGIQLAINETMDLEANDIVQFGSRCKFRVVDPKNVPSSDTPQQASLGEWDFVKSNYLKNFPRVDKQTMGNLDDLLENLATKIDDLNADLDGESFSLRLLLPSSMQAVVKAESLIAIERLLNATGKTELYDMSRFQQLVTSPSYQRMGTITSESGIGNGESDLIALLEKAKRTLDSIESKNKAILGLSINTT